MAALRKLAAFLHHQHLPFASGLVKPCPPYGFAQGIVHGTILRRHFDEKVIHLSGLAGWARKCSLQLEDFTGTFCLWRTPSMDDMMADSLDLENFVASRYGLLYRFSLGSIHDEAAAGRPVFKGFATLGAFHASNWKSPNL